MSKEHRRFRQWESFNQVVKNPLVKAGLIIIVLFVLSAIFAPWLAPYDPNEQDFSRTLQKPSLRHPLGTDEFGRDVLSRILYGARPTLIIVVGATAIGLAVGGLLGLISGYYGGNTDSVVMRMLDVILAFPGMVLALAIISATQPGMKAMIVAIAIYSIPHLARVTRGSVLGVKENDYVTAAWATGERTWSVILRYILPNAMMPILVLTFVRMATIVLIAASLSFLGLGIQPPAAEWGIMLSQGRNYMLVAPFLSIFPGIAIIVVILGFNFIGDGLRDALDPKFRKAG